MEELSKGGRIWVRIYLLTVAYIFSVVAHPIFANENSLPKLLHFKRLLTDQSIHLGEIDSLLNDSEGYMWFGGTAGLARFNGYEFEVIVSLGLDDNSLQPIKNVLSVFEDSNKNIWVGCAEGLAKFDKELGHLVWVNFMGQGELELSDPHVTTIAELADEQLIVATYNGLNLIDLKSKRTEFVYADKGSTSSRILNNNILALEVDPKGFVWVGSFGGLDRVDLSTGDIKHFLPFPDAPGVDQKNTVRTIEIDRHGSIWIGTRMGIFKLDPISFAMKHYKNDARDPFSIPDDEIEVIFEDSSGILWVGSDGGGLYLYDRTKDRFNSHRHVPSQMNSISSDTIRSISEDRSGDIWIGTFPMGVNFLDRTSMSSVLYQHSEINSLSLSYSRVVSVIDDAQKGLWVGTDGGGLNYFDKKTQNFLHFKYGGVEEYSLASKTVLAMLIDSSGTFWVGSWGGGLHSFDMEKKQFTQYPINDGEKYPGKSVSYGLNESSIWCLYEDKEGTLWIGTHDGGLNAYDPQTKKFTHYFGHNDDSQSLSHNIVWTVLEDSKGRFWVGTADGLNLMDRSTGLFRRIGAFSGPGSLSNPTVFVIYEDRRGRLWLGTAAGLNLYEPDSDTFKTYTKAQGLFDDYIGTIVEGPNGELWLGTSQGLSSFDPDTEKFINYTNEVPFMKGGYNRNSGLYSVDGKIYMGGVGGLLVYDPEKLQINRIQPPMVLSHLKIFSQELKPNVQNSILPKALNYMDSLTLDYTHSMFSISYAALNFKNTAKNQYAYMLEGFDRDWNFVGASRMATYTNLDPGQYRFRVKGSNNNDIWNEEGRSLNITILPPWWRTWWAYTIYSLLALSLLYWFTYTQRQKVTLIKEKLAHERLKHSQSEMVQQKSMESLSLLVSGVAHEINNPNNFAYTSVYNLEADLVKFKNKLFEAAGDDADKELMAEFDKDFIRLFQILSSMKNGTTRIKDIVESLKTFSSADQAERKDVDLVHDLSLVVDLLRTSYENDVKFELDMPEKLLLYGNPVELNQLFVNVITNACQAIEIRHTKIPKDGLGIVSIKLYQDRSDIRVVVQDSGCGMSSETLAHIFDPFYTTKEVGSGAGLGLSMAYGIVEKHCGKIEVKSEVGQGSVFTLIFPKYGLERLS